MKTKPEVDNTHDKQLFDLSSLFKL